MKNNSCVLKFCNLVFTSIILYSCHNAKAPEEKITTTTISQDSSLIFIPVSISNVSLSQLILSKVPNPLIDEKKKINIPVFNPVTAPILTLVPVAYTYPCDLVRNVTRHIPIIGNIIDKVVIHTTCNGIKEVDQWINQTIINKVNLNLPTEYMARINNIRLDGNANTLNVHAIVDFRFKADVPIAHIGLASCGFDEDLPQIELILSSKIKVANDGVLLLSDKNWGIKWNKPCNLTALNINVEDLLNLPLIKSIIENKINDLVQNKIPNSFDFKPKLQNNWGKISKPIKLDKIGNLDLSIFELSARNLFISADSMQTEVGAICKPVLILSDESPDTTTKPFPKLNVKNGNDSFNINILGTTTFKSLNKYANQVLSNYKEKIGNRYLQINEVNLYQHADSLVVEVNLHKPFTGKIYLWGVPKFDLAQNMISLQNLQYTIDSKNLLVKMANWLLDLPILQNKISEKFKFKYEKSIADAINKVKNLEYPIASNIDLRVSCNEIKPVNITVSDNKLNIVVNLKGQALIKMR